MQRLIVGRFQCTATRLHCNSVAPLSRLFVPLRHYGRKKGKKTSYRAKDDAHRYWLEHVQLTDEKYNVWTKDFDRLTTDRLVDEDLVNAIETIHEKLMTSGFELKGLMNPDCKEMKQVDVHTVESNSGEEKQEEEFVIPVRLPETFEDALLQWMDDTGLMTISVPTDGEQKEGEQTVTLFELHEENGGKRGVHHGIVQAFLHSSYIVQYGDYVDSADMQRMLSLYSMEELSKVGSEMMDSMSTHFLSYAMQPASRSRFLQIASPRYDLQPYEFTSFDLIDYHNIAMENVKRAKETIVDAQMLISISQELNLHSLLLHEIGIVEAEEGKEAMVLEDELDEELNDPRLPKTRQRKLENIRRATMPANVVVFETDVDTAMATFREVIDRQLIEALLGAIQVHYGPKYTAAFYAQKLLPLVQERLAQLDTTDYVELLRELLDKHNATPEYRVDKDIFKRRQHRAIKVNVVVRDEVLGYAFGETYSESKYNAAKAVYLDLMKNPLRLEKIQHKLTNMAYVRSLARLMPS